MGIFDKLIFMKGTCLVFSGYDGRSHIMLSSKIFRKVHIRNNSSGNCQLKFLKFSLKDFYDFTLTSWLITEQLTSKIFQIILILVTYKTAKRNNSKKFHPPFITGVIFSSRTSRLCLKHAKNDSFCIKKNGKNKKKKTPSGFSWKKNYSIKNCQ